MWHWQQYLTLSGASLGAFLFLIGLIMVPNDKKSTQVIQLLIIAAGQYVLYSGGWYN